MIDNSAILVNLFANITTFVCLVLFYIYIFGDSNKVVARWDFISHWSLRLGMMLMIGGTFFNTLTLSTPSWSEILLNLGLGIVMVWVVLFHRNLFNKAKQTETK